MQTIDAAYSDIPDEITEGPTLVIIRDNIVLETIEREEGTETMWTCTEHRLSHAEYAELVKGRIFGEWTSALHKAFRTAQHRRTDDLYNVAYRSKRNASSTSAWAAYITALDEWNEAVSALASTYSTDVPDLPDMPE